MAIDGHTVTVLRRSPIAKPDEAAQNAEAVSRYRRAIRNLDQQSEIPAAISRRNKRTSIKAPLRRGSNTELGILLGIAGPAIILVSGVSTLICESCSCFCSFGN